MHKVVLDSNAVDPMADVPGAFEALEAGVKAGELAVLYTHITVEELLDITDPERRAHLLLLLIELGQLVSTGAFVLDYSRLNFARFTVDPEATEAFRSGNVAHTRDALIAATAQVEQCTLVTNDRRLANRARERGVDVMTMHELLATRGFELPA